MPVAARRLDFGKPVVDDGAPTVTINQAAQTVSQPPGPQPDPTTILPIEFEVVFSAPVPGFDGSDIRLDGSTADITRAYKAVSGSGANYRLFVSGIATQGQIEASIPAGVAVDTDGNQHAASGSANNLVTLSSELRHRQRAHYRCGQWQRFRGCDAETVSDERENPLRSHQSVRLLSFRRCADR